jgi:hypothetical protein
MALNHAEKDAHELLRELEQSQELQDELLVYWLKRLSTSAAKLHDIARGHGPQIRARYFRIGRCVWPVHDMREIRHEIILRSETLWMYIHTGTGINLLGPSHHRETVQALQRDIRYRPRAALRAIRTLQAAVAWCDARIVGHEKSRFHDVQLQMASKAQNALRSEAVVAALAKE